MRNILKEKKKKKNNQILKNKEEEIPKLKETQNDRLKHVVVYGAVKFPSYLDNLPYVEGQWSFTNPTGKKVYSILFLLKVGSEAICQKKPYVLNNWSTKSFIAPQFSSLSNILKEKKKNKNNQILKNKEEEIPKLKETQNDRLKHVVVYGAVKFPSYLDNLPYVEGQWSFTNPTGKKVYSILFLLKVGSEAICQKKPYVLNNWSTKSFIAPQFSSLSCLGAKYNLVSETVILDRSHGKLLMLKETVEHPLNSVVAYKINMKCKSILVDYEELNNLNEIIYSLSEDESSVIRTRHKEFVKSMSLIILDCPITRTTVAGTIFAELLSKKILSMEAITQGFDDVLKYWCDFLIYYPQFFSYIAAIIAPLLLSQNTSFDFNNLKDSCTSIRPDNSSKLFTEVLYKINSSKETQNVKEHLGGILWIYNKWNMLENIPLGVFMPNNQINKYFKKDQVGVFILSIAMYDQIKLTDNKLLYDILQSWISTNISAEIIKSSLFVRALTVAIVIVCLKLNHSYEDFFDHVHVKMLTHYIKLKPLPKNEIQAREVQCMFGIQIMSATLKHPTGMVLKLFNQLHQDRVISKESFELFIQEYEKIAEK
ncbi:uncharacterized protein LOC132947405 isoform X2 [Metopolophium dirhodum]|uniref:uncharacterized protein LOC132947405 isoform X2 n=1 Tax=Metopolophium dirhodum TaxID=44670 RepID=UPI00299024B8|nr:uncharacterized protein LOC132947405 isoform X2 [Metopolophium dirhodum]XP_060873666.1 uncharacterized protein LOC132947405 isoform X2 [Metopolophium dirhodum]